MWLLRVACSSAICAPGSSRPAPTHPSAPSAPWSVTQLYSKRKSTELTSGQVQNYQMGWVCPLVSHQLCRVQGVCFSAHDAGQPQHVSLLPLLSPTSLLHPNYHSPSRTTNNSFSWPEQLSCSSTDSSSGTALLSSPQLCCGSPPSRQLQWPSRAGCPTTGNFQCATRPQANDFTLLHPPCSFTLSSFVLRLQTLGNKSWSQL